SNSPFSALIRESSPSRSARASLASLFLTLSRVWRAISPLRTFSFNLLRPTMSSSGPARGPSLSAAATRYALRTPLTIVANGIDSPALSALAFMRFDDSLTKVQSRKRFTWSPASRSTREISTVSARATRPCLRGRLASGRFAPSSALELLLLAIKNPSFYCNRRRSQGYDLSTLIPKYVNLILVILKGVLLVPLVTKSPLISPCFFMNNRYSST